MHVFKHLRRQQAKIDKDPAKLVRRPLGMGAVWGGERWRQQA